MLDVGCRVTGVEKDGRRKMVCVVLEGAFIGQEEHIKFSFKIKQPSVRRGNLWVEFKDEL